jgi:DNA replication protein DnaC
MAICEICDGIGLVPTGRGSAQRCQCQTEQERSIRLNRVGIPRLFSSSTLAGFQTASPHAQKALGLAHRYVASYIPGQTKTGLLLSGSTGAGKTHLAVGIARQLVEEKGIEARFVGMDDLIDRLRNASFEKDAAESKRDIMQPIYAGELIVIDELGGAALNDFVFDIIERLIGRLYNEQYPVIVTTNSLNQQFDPKARQPTLGERIGQRMFSRLQQMCFAIDMTGPDWRTKK